MGSGLGGRRPSDGVVINSDDDDFVSGEADGEDDDAALEFSACDY
jgi:hypothetical protein